MITDLPHRKPLPSFQPQSTSPNTHSHSRTRTSSDTFPTILYPQQKQNNYSMQSQGYNSRRTPSQGTFSTMASRGNSPVAYRQTSQDLQRSGSSRSGGQPSGYVALMRKQKATVWCDRSQYEDPRMIAQQKAAKMRAAMEVSGGKQQGRLSTSGSGTFTGSKGVTAKIRHHGKANLVGYSPGELVGNGVPMRLSATEVEGGDSDDDADSGPGFHHQRSGSGRSSNGSSRPGLTYRKSGASSTGRWSSGNTPPGERADVTEAGETPVPTGHPRARNYFSGDGSRDGTRSAGSGSSGERADNVGELGTEDAARLASNSLLKSTITREKSTKNPEELRRRGSVDDRTMTMSAGRLYIANPDADSD